MANKSSAECGVRNAELTKLLKEFCSVEESRPTLHTPFSQGIWSYATDGRIILRVPRLEDVPDRGDAPNVGQMYVNQNIPSDFGKLKGWVEMPELPEIQYNLCDDCFGSGGCDVCPACDAGIKLSGGECVECENKDFTNCTRIKCFNCKGVGKFPVPTRITLGNTDLNLIYLRKMNRLKGLSFSPTMPSPNDPVPFKFEDGDGLLMPMRKAIS
jgi:hypothetical protein